MRSKSRQNFQYIPFCKLFQKIEYKAEYYCIDVVYTGEAHTSVCSYLNKESLEHHESYMGKRVYRGLFRSSRGVLINADVNGSADIGRKVIREDDFFIRLDRSVAATPAKINPLKAFCKEQQNVVDFSNLLML